MFFLEKFFFIACSFLISNIAIAQFGSNPLSQAVDNTDFSFLAVNTSNTPIAQNEAFNFDSDAILLEAFVDESDPTLNINTSEVFTFVSDAITVTFDWKVSSARGRNGLVFAVINSETNAIVNDRIISGEVDWETKKIDIPSGGHFLVWGYLRGAEISGGQNAGWVDNIRIGSTGGERVNDPIPVASKLPPIMSLLLDDPIIPADILISNITVEEGETANFSIKLAEPLQQNITLTCFTNFGTAGRFDITELLPLNVEFIRGETEKIIPVSTRIDRSDFGEKSFTLKCDQVGTLQSAVGTATILYKPNIQFSQLLDDPSVLEGETLELQVDIQGDINTPISIDYSFKKDSSPINPDVIDNTGGAITFEPGITSTTISLTIPENEVIERAKVFSVSLDYQSEVADVFDSSQEIIVLDNESNFSSEANIEDMIPLINDISEKGPHVLIQSVENDRVGDGLDYAYNQLNSNIELSQNNNQIEISIDGNSHSTFSSEVWDIRLASGIRELSIGTYTSAYTDPIRGSNENQLSIFRSPSSDPFSCESKSGLSSFRIFELEYDVVNSNKIAKLSADFELFCDHLNEPVRGSIKFDSSLPNPEFPPLVLPLGEPVPELPDVNTLQSVFVFENPLNFIMNEPLTLSNLDSTFSISKFTGKRGVNIYITPDDGSASWSIVLQNSILRTDGFDSSLIKGVYKNASNSISSDTKPFLSLNSQGNVFCSEGLGEFQIFDIEYDSEEEISLFIADFDYSCSSSTTVYEGSIRYIAE